VNGHPPFRASREGYSQPAWRLLTATIDRRIRRKERVMTTQQTQDSLSLRLHPAPPRGFDPFTASVEDLKRHGLPQRPDPHSQPGLAALWQRQARRWHGFEHLEPKLDPAGAPTHRPARAFGIGPDPSESCGYSLFSTAGPFTALFITWTVPDLHFVADPQGTNHLHTFVGLGFLDVHVEMTVDESNNVTSQLWAEGVGNVNLPVRPGDMLSASICLDTAPPGRANYVLANETTAQTMNFSFDTGFPPAVTVDAGVTRDDINLPFRPLGRFGAVYFDEISAYSTSGHQSLTAGSAITMVDRNGGTLATPVRLTDYAFKVLYVGA
jgi:hypothetical protein